MTGGVGRCLGVLASTALALLLLGGGGHPPSVVAAQAGGAAALDLAAAAVLPGDADDDGYGVSLSESQTLGDVAARLNGLQGGDEDDRTARSRRRWPTPAGDRRTPAG